MIWLVCIVGVFGVSVVVALLVGAYLRRLADSEPDPRNYPARSADRKRRYSPTKNAAPPERGEGGRS
jgi:hypothetical protein